MNEKEPKKCLHCSNNAERGIHCPKCRCFTDMMMIIEAYSGSPFICKQLTDSLVAAKIATCKGLEQRGTSTNVPMLVGLAKKLRAVEINNKQSGLLGSVLTRLNKRHAKAAG